MFDANQFLDMQITEALDTVLVPVPEGEYIGIAAEVVCRPWQSKKDPSVAGLALDIKWDLEVTAELKAVTGRDKISLKQGIMLDLSESGGLDLGKGKNVGLGRLREALGMNKPGVPFAFSQIPGNPAKLSVKHRIDDSVVPAAVYAEVKGNAKPY